MNRIPNRTTNETLPRGPQGPRSVVIGLCAALLAVGMSGCTTLLSPISGIPAHRVPCQFLGEPRANLVPVDLSRLRQDPPDEYRLGAKDVLGVFVEGVLGNKDEPPPVHFPEDGNREPALGYPIPIREDNTIALPLIPPLRVSGKTLTEAQEMILTQYVERQILKPDSRILVTLIRPRTYKVVVIRQDQGGGANNAMGGGASTFVRGSSQVGSGQVVNLPAYENDVLHALAATGGLPGLDAKNEVKILRGKYSNAKEREEFLKSMWEREKGHHPDPCICPPPLLEDPTIIKIPLRLPPGEFLDLRAEDILLEQGDIVMIETRDTEVFYTGGMLGGREIPLPRDYDLDILGAIALAGGTLAQGGGGFGGLAGGLGGAAPSNAFVLRPLACGGQITIVVDLNRALSDPATRILIQPKDTVILRYKPREELVNFGIATFFIQGIQRLFNNN